MITITPEDSRFMVDLAIEARRRAYAPYSNYAVGAALRTTGGRIFTGVNIENAAYPTTICAERVAMFTAVAQGEKEFDVIAVVTANGGYPCGGCRQVMAEFGLDTVVIIADETGRVVEQTTVNGLLPGAFTPAHLKI
jgi:cytidine deaminase